MDFELPREAAQSTYMTFTLIESDVKEYKNLRIKFQNLRIKIQKTKFISLFNSQ